MSETSPVHGVENWHLDDYEWDPEDGIGRYSYSRELDGTAEFSVIYKVQPYHPKHTGWSLRAITN